MSRGISDSSLRWWEKQLAKRSAVSITPPPSPEARPSKPKTRSPSLARVIRPGQDITGEDAGIALVVGEITLVVRRGFDRALLREVVHALSEAR